MASALGQELEEGDILTPALTLGGAGVSGIPAEKFAAKNRCGAFFMCDKEWKPMTERALPAADGFAGASVIHPAKLMTK
eukprot:CAMPEP_0180688364 /NCGR_PEP_ID=MMETSP1037_2-20121125/73935_1 /TAXON_ID=632150 /ORGANISM="Azadinium spinosum, Strain 3D9" /LENGTH=78 /DNA_ID=CAMNT_0022719187 /DNA_START=66 /DNA_END=299 /DNA_ORIENTATION=-